MEGPQTFVKKRSIHIVIRGALILIAFHLAGRVYAQSDFRPGYVVKEIGDTIFGEVDLRGPLFAGNTCRIKSGDTSAVSTYAPGEIHSYRYIDGKYYISKEIEGQEVFLEYLIKGKLNIYYLKNEEGDHYYLDKESVPLTEIPYQESIKYREGGQHLHQSTFHIGLLNYHMQDAPEVQEKTTRIKKPNHQNLIALAKSYHNAVDEDEPFVLYAQSHNKIKLLAETYFGRVKYVDESGYLNEVGASIFIRFPGANERFYLRSGIILQPRTISTETTRRYKFPFYLQYISSTQGLALRLGIGTNFIPAVGLATFNINGGLNYGISESWNLSFNLNVERGPFSEGLFPPYTHTAMLGLLYELN